MKNSKRLLSFLLVFLMMFSIFADTAYALSSSALEGKTDGQLKGRVEGNQEVFEFDSNIINTKEKANSRRSKRSTNEAQSFGSTAFRSMPQPMRAPQSESDDTTIELTTVGLNNQAFDWSVFPDKSFKITAKWNTNDGKTHVKENFATLTEDGNTTYNVGWPKDGSMTGSASIVVDFNNNVKIMAVASRPTSTPDGAGIKFSFKVMQLPNTIVEVKYVDPYGNPLNEGMPQDSATMPNVTIDELPDIQDIKLTNKSETLNFRESEDFDEIEANNLANGLTFKVDGKTTGEKVTIDGKDYKLDISAPNAKEQGTIKLAYQADVLVPPVDPTQADSGTPVPTPEGYVRLTFDANENKADGVKGTFTNESPYLGKDKSYIDVKEGLQYDNESLTNAIEALTVQGTKDQKEYTQDLQNPWTPKVLTSGAVIEATYNANYKYSIADQVTELGGLKAKDIAVWVGDQITWANGVEAKDAAKKAEIEALLQGATVEDQSNRNSDAKGEYPGKLKVTFDDKSTLEVDNQMLYVYANGDEKPEDGKPVPTDAATVTFTKDDNSIKADGWDTVKPIIVKKGTAVPAEKFPNAEAKEGYKSVTWTPAKDTVVNDDQTFNAKATLDTNFDKTNIVEITFVKDPDKMSYTEGDPLNQDGLKIKLKDKNGNEVTIGKDKLNEYGVTVTPNDGTNLTINDHDGNNLIASVKNKDGRTITDNSPGTLTVTKKVEGKPSVNYPDTEVEKGKTETVTPKVTDNDGKPVPENKVGTPTVTNTNDLPEGVTVTPKDNGKVDITVPDGYDGPKDFTVKVTVPVDGKDVESEIKVTVKDKTTPTPQGPSVTYPDTDMDKGDTKTVIPEIKDKKGEPTRPDTTPEVVQPGNGVVVTPNRDGSITVTIPEDYDGPSTIVIPVVVTVDGEEIHTTLTIRVRDNKPVIDYDIPELKIHEYTPTYPVYASVDKKVVEKEVINSHDQYIFGYPDDTIRPDGDMTRAEAIAVVARLQKLDLSDKSSKIYKDTKADMWYNGAINAAFREGYLLEKEGENVRPNDKITRAELAELISHIDKKNNTVAPFDDVKGHKFEAAINQAYGNGRIEGYPDGTFKPDNFITRAEVATMLNKLYDRYPDKNFIDANQNLVHNYKDMSYKGHWGYYELVEAYHSHTYLRLKDNMEEWKVIIK